MNCQEVMELMQRYLDEDLDENEQDELHRHIRNCPECTEMFERLQRLSNDLANLPKVVPPYSIVDSILPQLERLDRANPGALSASEDEVRSQSEPRQAQIPAGVRQPRNRIISWKWVSGVVAAGLVIGVVALQVPFGGRPADVLSNMESAGQSAESAGVLRITGEKGAPEGWHNDQELSETDQPATGQDKPPAGASSPDHLAEQQSSADRPVSETVKKNAAPEAAEKEKGASASTFAEAFGGKDAPSGDGEPYSSPGRAGALSDAGSFDREEAPEGSGGLNRQQTLPEPDPEVVPKPETYEMKGPQDGNRERSAPEPGERAMINAEKALPAPSADESMDGERLGEANSFSSLAISQRLPSPDGMYSAQVEDRRVVIRKTEGGDIVYSSIFTWGDKGEIVLVGWEESRLLYEVNLPGGSKRVVIDLSAKSETARNE